LELNSNRHTEPRILYWGLSFDLIDNIC
jgi:hypothetical protein